MSRPKKLALLAIVLVAIVAAGWWALRSGDPTAFAKGERVELADFKGSDPTGAPANLANADLVARGEYLTRAADCAACHTVPGGKPFAGGLPFKLPMIGTIYSTNITPDQETGIGAWSDEQFLKALHKGIGKDGKHLYPAFPYTSYALMTDSDVLSIKAYLLTLKPVNYTPPPNNISFPFNQRYLMMFWNALFKPSHRFRPNQDQPAEWNRGAYLVEALGHCGDCHTPRNILFGLNNKRKFAGALIQGWKAYNITPDLHWGIGIPTSSSSVICQSAMPRAGARPAARCPRSSTTVCAISPSRTSRRSQPI
jgi:mono/diheme cytochrome c family protein